MSWSSYVNHIAMHDMTLVTEHKKSPGRCLLRSRRMSQEPSKFFFFLLQPQDSPPGGHYKKCTCTATETTFMAPARMLLKCGYRD